MNPPKREQTIFAEALRLPPEERAAYLAQATDGDADLRREVESLLQSYGSGEFLEEAALAKLRPALPTAPVTEKPGDRIDRYKLLEQIGEGGCGVVYVAEQTEPVRRRVALKIVKLGMDTKSVIARFEAERQALALMDHPHIAKVFDAGATDTGRPYFVMELVRGLKITDYSDEKKLSTEARLNLFMKVCQAIQHAHQKGIIHRDIKPSNILVTVNDGVAVPKVIDFGVAKATGGQILTDKTIYTAFEQFIGTPAYMSPEQAVLTSLDVDTRSDIYALGVLLYELLTGQTPFDARELLAIGLDEMRRTIREKEPDRPSMRLSTLPGEELGTTAQRRGLEAPKLVSELRGDLDWIVMKCLEKDRARRYESANGVAMDVQRHLNNEPVLARPPSRWYEFQKTVRRHKVGFTATAAVMVALASGLAVAGWMFLQERAALRRAMTAEQEQNRLRQEAEVARVQAQADAKKAQTEAARSQEVAQLLKDILDGVGPSESNVEAETLTRDGLEMTRRLLGDEHPALAMYLANLAAVQRDKGNLAEAEALYRQALETGRKVLGNEHSWVVKCLKELAIALARQWNWREAADCFASLLQHEPTNHRHYHDLAPLLVAIGDLDKYRNLCKEIVARFGDTTDGFISDKMTKDCSILPSSGTDPEAVAKMAAAAAATGPNQSGFYFYHQLAAGMAEYRRGHFADALTFVGKTIALREKYHGKYVHDTICVEAYAVCAMAHFQLQQTEQARAALAKSSTVAARLPTLESGPLTYDHLGDWIIAHKLLEEATALIEGKGRTEPDTK